MDKAAPISRDGTPPRVTALAGTPTTAAAAQPGSEPPRKAGSPGITLDDPVSPLDPRRARPVPAPAPSGPRAMGGPAPPIAIAAPTPGAVRETEQASFGRRLFAPVSILTGIVSFALGCGVGVLLHGLVLAESSSGPRGPSHPAPYAKPHPTAKRP